VDPFEAHLGQGRRIPKETASAYFVLLKTGGRLLPEDDALFADCLGRVFSQAKTAGEQELTETPGRARLTAPRGPRAPDAADYFESETLGRQAEAEQAAEYYAARLREAASELRALEERAQAAEGALAEAEAALSGVEGQMQSAEQAGQIAGQAALQNVQAANAAAAQAMERAVDAEDRALMAMSEAAQAKLTLQTLREKMLELASEDPGLTGASPAPEAAAIEPAAPGALEAPPADAPASPASPDVSAPGPEGPTIPNSNAPAAAGESSERPPGAPVSIKVGVHPALAGVLVGGATGAGLSGLEAAGKGPDLGRLRARVEAGEAGAREPGLGGFARAFALARDKALLTLGEATRDHPLEAVITGGLVGAGLGGALGPRVARGAREAVGHWQRTSALPGAP
jgi:ribonuclease E